MSGNEKRPRGVTSGRYSSMIKGYVKGGSFVKRKMHADSKASLGVASAGWISARWLPQTGFPGFQKGIQRARVVIRQAFDIESLFPKFVR